MANGYEIVHELADWSSNQDPVQLDAPVGKAAVWAFSVSSSAPTNGLASGQPDQRIEPVISGWVMTGAVFHPPDMNDRDLYLVCIEV